MTRKVLISLFFLGALYITIAYIYNTQFTQTAIFDRTSVTEEFIKSTEDIKKKDTVNILIIEGGGVRGLIPLYIIQYLESRLGKPISELFDVYSGVSTGAAIASGINVPFESIPEYRGGDLTATEYMIKVYQEDTDYVFSSPWYHKLLTAGGLFSPSFLGDRLHKTLVKHYSKNLPFTELKNYVIIPALDVHSGKIHLFKNRGASVTDLPTNTTYQLVTASVSAETAFPPVIFRAADGETKHRFFADAGMAINNPTSLILLDIIKEFPGKNYYFLILGAGNPPLAGAKISYDQIKNWGRLRWLRDAFSNIQISMDHQQIFTLEIAKSLSSKGRIEYDYLDIDIAEPFVGIFDAHSKEHLRAYADQLIEDNRPTLERIIKHLQQQNQ
ncbi:patatin-like phospholipase family protein [Microbulbifer sp. GL-2]|uniref:patatin-like phospholipase family protein n=1 Tax=Microbulbifer sp. GL-2 TaxID=2591606 RepID=UPI00117E3FC4|nr:patatin-like phospholipase family protein [Microbulbifer sp. GL-2]